MDHSIRGTIMTLACLILLAGCDKSQPEQPGQQPTAPQEQSAAQVEGQPATGQQGSTELADPALYSTAHLAPRVIAERNLRGLFDEASIYYERHQETWEEGLPPLQFPNSTPLTPPEIPCGSPVPPNPEWFQQPTWQALHFLPTDPIWFSYQFESSGTGRRSSFTATAYGDTDCDGIMATLRKVGSFTSSGHIQGVGTTLTENPDE
ncbi:MAG: hypothetical protein JW797_08230 [Bradymonadales bacterium]|nr:hypothetical protein [Bradymonadales bacterium]